MNRSLIPVWMTMSALAVLSPILSGRLIAIGEFKASAGVITIALMSTLLDVVHEMGGWKMASWTAASVGIARLVTFGTVFLVLLLPIATEVHGFSNLWAFNARAIIAGEISILATALFVDIPIFANLNRRLRGHYYVARAGLSNILSFTLSSCIFVVLTFGFDESIIKGQIFARMIMAVVFVPIGWGVLYACRFGEQRWS